MTGEKPVSSPTPWREVTQPFIDLVRAPRALWGVNLSYFLEGLVYFGWLALLAIFFNRYVGLNDIWADWMVSILTAGITLSQLVMGGVADRIGPRRALIAATATMLIGRTAMVVFGAILPGGGGPGSALHIAVVVALVCVAIGYGLYQPAAYAAVRRYCDARTSAMGYAMLYAVMNLGAALPGFLSPPIRMAYGIPGVFWTYVGLTAAGLVVLFAVLTRRVDREAALMADAWTREHRAEEAARQDLLAGAAASDRDRLSTAPWTARLGHWIRNHPLADPRFAFFIFALIPVQTLFAHNWLTLPQYVDRCMGQVGSDYMEFFVNFINPTLIFILTPMVAALTRDRDVYGMMIAGTFVMAAPTFLLAASTNLVSLIAFLVIMSVGEAMWQPRFLQLAAEIAPPGRTGAYLGVAQFPWFLTKVITGLYAGWFLQHYTPEGGGAGRAREMWLIYSLIAMSSTALLIAARGWVRRGFRTTA